MSCSSAARRRSRSERRIRAERVGQAHHDHAGAIRVAVGPGRLRVDDAGERVGDPVETLLVGVQQAVLGLPRRDVARRQRARPRTPCHRGTSRAASTSAGSNQLARTLVEHATTPRPTPPAAWKISAVWARQRIRPSSGISVAAQARAAGRGRPSARRARGSRRRSRVRKPSMSAISAPRSQRASISAFVTSPSALIASSRSTRARGDPPGATVRTRPGECRQRPRPVGPLRGVLGHVVVGAEQRRHAAQSWPSSLRP